jgi:Na+-transporting NADH:ubiquinone oxidoreductase subunit F
VASNAKTEHTLRFNVRIATPPPGQGCRPGIGSSYVFNLKPGEEIVATGRFGDFHIKPTQRETIYIGGGAGKAPFRAHLSDVLENERTARRISLWYGARSRQEILYEDYFSGIAHEHRNFAFHLALSKALPEDSWTGNVSFIHDIVLERYLIEHPHLASAKFYLCGPPRMIKACTRMLDGMGVPIYQIAYDQF